jgi:hypothetical protein
MRKEMPVARLPRVSGSTFCLLAALLLLSGLARATDEPWKGKRYDQWTDSDVQRVFTDSPWSRTATITRTWLPLSAKDFPVSRSLDGAARKLPKGIEQSDDATLGTDLIFNIYWGSSRVMRAASARQSVLHGDQKDLDVAKYANEPQAEYQIIVQSKDMAPFVRKDEKFFQANAFLQLRKTKEKLLPSHVRYERGEDGLLVVAAVFFFPRKTPSGEPTIDSDEKSAEFNCRIEGSTLRANFEPRKMVDGNGPAL